MNKDFKHKIIFGPAHDKRDEDPKKDYGIGSVRFWFVLTGEKGAVTLNFGTNWFLPETVKEYKEGFFPNDFKTGKKKNVKEQIDLHATTEPMRPWSIDYHQLTPHYEGQEPLKGCEFLDGKDCYCDGSCLNADKFKDILLREGSKGVWKVLEEEYKNYFLEKDV